MERIKVVAILVLALSLMACPTKVSGQVPLGTAFTYQGQLMDKNKPADGLYDFQFKLYDGNDPNTDSQLGSPIDINDLDVLDGHFMVELNFGSGIFDGNAVWLETRIVESPMGSDPCTLSPLLELTPTPYAMYAATVPPAIAGGIIPNGGIIMWSGSIANIPSGWALCDGTNGTPDLRDKFIVGAGSSYDVNDIGGEEFHTLTIPEMPSHTHQYGFNMGSGGDEGGARSGNNNSVRDTGSTGGGQPHENRPPYFALAYIMRLP